MSEDSEVIIGFLLVIALTIGLFLACWPLMALACHRQWDSSGLEVRFEVFGGCQLQAGTGWIPAKNYRVF